MYTIQQTSVQRTLDRMHQEANSEGMTILKGLTKGVFRKLEPADMSKAYIAISEGQGKYIYDLLVENQVRHIVEFGTSFGISTLYLAAAAQVNDGKVITTELLPEKCLVAAQNFEEAGMTPWIDLREGDAMETLKEVEAGIEFLLLDGWNDLYLPLLKLLEPKLKPGCLIYTDNASFPSAQPFLRYLKAHPETYRSRRLYDDKGGSELTEFLG
ncbi:MAG: class I SAM-dependent methyltransferase [Bacteroidota bacterium]